MPTFDAKIESALGNQYPIAVIPLINSAQNSIKIIMYEWKWYSYESAGGVEKFNLAMQNAARRGVKIKVLLNIESMGHALTKINGNTATHLKLAGVDVKFGQIGIATHAKMLIFDDRHMVLGSHNISKGSFSKNQEASIIIHDSLGTRPYIDYFQHLWDITFNG